MMINLHVPNGVVPEPPAIKWQVEIPWYSCKFDAIPLQSTLWVFLSLLSQESWDSWIIWLMIDETQEAFDIIWDLWQTLNEQHSPNISQQPCMTAAHINQQSILVFQQSASLNMAKFIYVAYHQAMLGLADNLHRPFQFGTIFIHILLSLKACW